jgi:hypothetical protein
MGHLCRSDPRFPGGTPMALWLRPQSAIPRPAQVAAFFDRSDHTSPGRRPRSIHGNVTFPVSTRRRSKTRRDPFAARSMTAQSRCSSTSLPPLMAHNRAAPPGWSRGRARRQPNRVAAFQPNSVARPAQFSSPVKKLLQSLKNWRHRYGGPTTPSGTIPAPCNPQSLSSAQTGSQMLSPRAAWNWLGTRGHPVTVWLSRRLTLTSAGA